MVRRLLASVVVVLLCSTSAAQAASGSLTDPSGDFPDIIKLSFNNKQGGVAMAMTYSESRPQNESFYMRWGTDASKYYQVFASPSAGLEELRLNGDRVRCGSLEVTHDADAVVTRMTVPRTCLSRAPNRLRFQGIATEGLSNSDQTRLSAAIARG